MRLEQLQYFVQIVESRSFNEASRRLHITQPALTHSIKALEEELGVQLLMRSRRGAMPTAWGARVYKDCKSLLESLNAKIDSWKSVTSPENKQVVQIVAIPSASNYLAMHLLPKIEKELSDIYIILHEAIVYDMHNFIANNPIRIAVTAFLDTEADKMKRVFQSCHFSCTPLMHDEYHVFLHCEHPLAEREYITINDCPTLNIATYSNQYGQHSPILKSIEEKIHIHEYQYINSRDNIMQMIAQGNAAGFFLHRMNAYNWYVRKGLIRVLPVRGETIAPSTHYLLHMKDEALSDAERMVKDFILEHYCD